MASRRGSPPPRPLALTARDRALLAFAAEHRIVLAAQLARLVGCSETAARRRLRTLRDGGLVTDTRPLRHAPTAWAITRAGLRAIEAPFGTPPALDLAAYRHDIGLGWLAVAAHAGRFGELAEIVTERRMRSEDARGARSAARGPGHPAADGLGEPTAAAGLRNPTTNPGRARHGVRLGGWGAGPRLHYPDLVLVTPAGHRVAIELELTTKTPVRRERILAAYAVDPSIDAVVYLVERPAAGRAIARSAARVGATDKLRIQRCGWADGRAPGLPASPARDRTRDRSGELSPSAGGQTQTDRLPIGAAR